MFGIGLGEIIAFILGGIVVGVIANRRPEWFASLVRLANRIDDKVNTNVTAVVTKVTNK